MPLPACSQDAWQCLMYPLLHGPSHFPTWQCQLLYLDLPETKASCVEALVHCQQQGLLMRLVSMV